MSLRKGQPVQSGGREAANTLENKLLSGNERILKEIFNIYMDKDFGLATIGRMLDSEVRLPRRKIHVLLMGNHSAGKSSFINWYIEESILKTGVAIETQGFALVTSGKKRETLKGPATLQLYPHLRPLDAMSGVVDFLSTEVSTSRAKKFNMITFIDTPGLVDGDMHYPFDVNETLLWLGEMADMVICFFDPMGQALCKRTLNVLEKLWALHSDKVRLVLAKADEAGSETDRQKVLMQIVQELCKRPGLNRSGFDMPTIYLPSEIHKPTKCANQIEDLLKDIEKMIDQTVQNSLNNLERDCTVFQRKLQHQLRFDAEARNRNVKRWFKSWSLGAIGFLFPIILFVSMTVANTTVEAMRKHIGQTADLVHFISQPTVALWNFVPPVYRLETITCVVILSGIFLIISRLSPVEVTLPSRELKTFRAAETQVERIFAKKREMYSEYLKQSLTEEDFYG